MSTYSQEMKKKYGVPFDPTKLKRVKGFKFGDRVEVITDAEGYQSGVPRGALGTVWAIQGVGGGYAISPDPLHKMLYVKWDKYGEESVWIGNVTKANYKKNPRKLKMETGFDNRDITKSGDGVLLANGFTAAGDDFDTRNHALRSLPASITRSNHDIVFQVNKRGNYDMWIRPVSRRPKRASKGKRNPSGPSLLLLGTVIAGTVGFIVLINKLKKTEEYTSGMYLIHRITGERWQISKIDYIYNETLNKTTSVLLITRLSDLKVEEVALEPGERLAYFNIDPDQNTYA